MSKAMPPDEMLGIAAAWLRCNEGDNGESDACKAVADWIEEQEQDRFLRKRAREAGVTVARLRRKLTEQAAGTKS